METERPRYHETLAEGFKEVAPKLAQVPGLIHKSFLVTPDIRQAGGCYLWESEEQARSFSEFTLRGMILERFGVECDLQYFLSPVQVEGTASAIGGVPETAK